MQTLRRLASGAPWAPAAVGIACTKLPAASVQAGDVVSLEGELTDNPMTHRVERIQPHGEGGWTISMKGDDNAFSGVPDHSVSGDVREPAAQSSGWGTAVLRVGTPAVALPLVIGLLGLLGLALLIPAPARARAPRRAGIATAEGAAA